MTEFKKLKEELAKVENADLGMQKDGNIFGFKICFSNQCFGPIMLCSKDENDEQYIPARGYAMIEDLLRLFDVDKFEQMRGKICFVLRDSERGMIVGLRTPEFETNKVFLLKNYQEDD
jgi:hypothetical protein